jgi:hypothetical protein
VGVPARSKLFHAIVGLGLAAAGCGGKEQSVAAGMDAGTGVHRDGASPGVGDPHEDAAALADAVAPNQPGQDAAMSLDSALAAGVAADVAKDVADEMWHFIPIQ